MNKLIMFIKESLLTIIPILTLTIIISCCLWIQYHNMKVVEYELIKHNINPKSCIGFVVTKHDLIIQYETIYKSIHELRIAINN